MIEQRVDDKIYIEEDSDGRDDVQIEEEGTEVALSFCVHAYLTHEEHEEDAVGYTDCEVLLFGAYDGLEIVEEECYDGKDGNENLEVDVFYDLEEKTMMSWAIFVRTGIVIYRVLLLGAAAVTTLSTQSASFPRRNFLTLIHLVGGGLHHWRHLHLMYI